MAHSQRGWVQYQSDPAPFGTIFEIKCDATTASNNGQTASNGPTFNNFWPLHSADLRHGYGIDASNHRDSCVATSTGSPVYTLGQTFQDNLGNVYTVNGLRSERFRTRDLK